MYTIWSVFSWITNFTEFLCFGMIRESYFHGISLLWIDHAHPRVWLRNKS